MTLEGNRRGKINEMLYGLGDGFFAIEMGNGEWYVFWSLRLLENDPRFEQDPCCNASQVYDALTLRQCRKWFKENRDEAIRRSRL